MNQIKDRLEIIAYITTIVWFIISLVKLFDISKNINNFVQNNTIKKETVGGDKKIQTFKQSWLGNKASHNTFNN